MRVQTTGNAAPLFPKRRQTRRRHESESILFSTHSRRTCPSSCTRARLVQLAQLTRLFIEEDFTVWRDSERCSSVLLGIYLRESLGESC